MAAIAHVWMRRGAWAAHAHRDGAQLCDTPHGKFAPGVDTKPLVAVPVGPHGLPYGRVCVRCLRILEAGKVGSAA